MIVVLAFAAGLIVLAFIIRGLQGGAGGSFEALGSMAKSVLAPIVDLINEPAFVYVASLAIVASALALIAYYHVRVIGPERRALRLAEIDVAGIAESQKTGWRAGTLAIGEILARRSVLLPSWTTYVQDARAQGRLPARRFVDYVEHDPSSPLGRQGGTMAAMPGYYTTIGLILTFVGLVVALYFASRGFRSGDMNEARHSIIQLLNASAFKFLTSVAALTSALMVSIAHRAGQSRLRSQTFRLVGAIQARLQAYEAAQEEDVDSNHLVVERLDLLLDEIRALRTALGPQPVTARVPT